MMSPEHAANELYCRTAYTGRNPCRPSSVLRSLLESLHFIHTISSSETTGTTDRAANGPPKVYEA